MSDSKESINDKYDLAELAARYHLVLPDNTLQALTELGDRLIQKLSALNKQGIHKHIDLSEHARKYSLEKLSRAFTCDFILLTLFASISPGKFLALEYKKENLDSILSEPLISTLLECPEEKGRIPPPPPPEDSSEEEEYFEEPIPPAPPLEECPTQDIPPAPPLEECPESDIPPAPPLEEYPKENKVGDKYKLVKIAEKFHLVLPADTLQAFNEVGDQLTAKLASLDAKTILAQIDLPERVQNLPLDTLRTYTRDYILRALVTSVCPGKSLAFEYKKEYLDERLCDPFTPLLQR